MRKLALTLLLLLSSYPAMAQMEYVPADHEVYDFLTMMHVQGRIQRYSRASLPLQIREVATYIRDLQDESDDLSPSQRQIVGKYYDEFVRYLDGDQARTELFSDGLSGVFTDDEKYLYTWASADRSTTFHMELLASLEQKIGIYESGTENATLAVLGGRFMGTAGGLIGYGLSSTNGAKFGNEELALRDRRLGQNFKIVADDDEFFDVTEAYINAGWEWGSLAIGNQRLVMGNSPLNPTILGLNPPTFNAVRLEIDVADFRFSYFHGFLSQAIEFDRETAPFADTKYIAGHRAEADIADAVRIGVFETIVYASRELDPAYLVPVNFFKSAEHAGGDRDNPMLGFDIQTLAFEGFEAYGSWTIDDVDYSRWGSDWWGNKFVWQGGVLTSAVLPNSLLGIEYTRIEPYTYSHFQLKNIYAHRNYLLSSGQPPNSDQWTVSLQHWFNERLRASGNFSIRRHGQNVYDDDGNITGNFGGDIYNTFHGNERENDLAPFLDGPRETSQFAEIQIVYEPLRDYTIAATYILEMRDNELLPESTLEHFFTLQIKIEY
ncbi:MAG: hypothetical protein CL946_08615 [Ectothiorhodospiraceae bacterium]|nr:hypothetical protein [Ectothiorhodospiraceae bacterium]